jgi:hypothetical protein
VINPGPDLTSSARGTPEWRPVKGEPDWVFACYQASAWPHFIRRLFDRHQLQPKDQRFTVNGEPRTSSPRTSTYSPVGSHPCPRTKEFP